MASWQRGELDWFEYAAVIFSLVVSVLSIFLTRSKPSGPALSSQLPLFAIAMSLVSSSISGKTLLAKPAEVYSHGTDFAFFFLITSTLLTILTQLIFFPVLSKLKSESIYDYFELRFSRSIRTMTATSYVIFKILFTSLQIIPAGIVISQLSSVSFNAIVCILMTVTTFYTTLGGYSGVVWSDAFQGIVMFGSMLVLGVVSIVRVGGLSDVIRIAVDTDRLRLPSLSLDPTDRIPAWAYLISLSGLSTLALNQSFYQRFKSLPHKRATIIALWFNLGGTVFFTFCSVIVGLSIYAYYNGCDPKSAKIVNSYMDVIVYWINDVGQEVKGFRGAYIAGITCASISTISSNINSSAGLICKELLWRQDRFKNGRYLKEIACVVGFISTGLALALGQSGSLIEITYSFATLDAIVAGLFILGVLVVPANTKGVLIGGTISLILSFVVLIGTRVSISTGTLQPYVNKEMRTDMCSFNASITETSHSISTARSQPFFLFRLSPFCGGPMAMVTVILTGYLASLWFENEDDSIRNINLYSPIVHKWVRRKCRSEKGLVPINSNAV